MTARCLSQRSGKGARVTGALIRGGSFNNGTSAGVFAVDGTYYPSYAGDFIGFRVAR